MSVCRQVYHDQTILTVSDVPVPQDMRDRVVAQDALLPEVFPRQVDDDEGRKQVRVSGGTPS